MEAIVNLLVGQSETSPFVYRWRSEEFSSSSPIEIGPDTLFRSNRRGQRGSGFALESFDGTRNKILPTGQKKTRKRLGLSCLPRQLPTRELFEVPCCLDRFSRTLRCVSILIKKDYLWKSSTVSIVASQRSIWFICRFIRFFLM